MSRKHYSIWSQFVCGLFFQNPCCLKILAGLLLFFQIILRDLGTEVVRLSLECLIGLNNKLFQTQLQQTEYGQCLRNQFRVRTIKLEFEVDFAKL